MTCTFHQVYPIGLEAPCYSNVILLFAVSSLPPFLHFCNSIDDPRTRRITILAENDSRPRNWQVIRRHPAFLEMPYSRNYGFTGFASRWPVVLSLKSPWVMGPLESHASTLLSPDLNWVGNFPTEIDILDWRDCRIIAERVSKETHPLIKPCYEYGTYLCNEKKVNATLEQQQQRDLIKRHMRNVGSHSEW